MNNSLVEKAMGLKVSELEKFVGGLSKPSKMPGYAYFTPAVSCMVGTLLSRVKGSVCGSCYAKKGRYVFPNVIRAMERRLKAIKKPGWAEYMVALLRKKYSKLPFDRRVFRWHDSGDIQSFEHLKSIIEIAKMLPEIRFWLPTREWAIIRDYLDCGGNFIPNNLAIRLSTAMIGQPYEAVRNYQGARIQWSTVGYDGKGAFQCPAYSQGGKCETCRACWDTSIHSVNYAKH
jgi:hypothetical protein